MKYSSRFFLYAPLALFLTLALATAIYWWVAASALSARLNTMNGQEAMPGVTFSFTSKSVSGFPFNLDVVFQDVTLTVATPHGPSSWNTQKLAMHGLTYGREQFIFEAAGHQMLHWTDLSGRPHAMPFEAGGLHASSITGTNGLSRFDLDLVGLGSPALTAGRVQLHARLAPYGTSIDLFAAADDVRLSPALASLFGADITQMRLNASAAPVRAFQSLRAGNNDWVGALEAWRTENGALQVDDIEISWNRVGAMGKGRLALDANHSVDGYLDFKVAGIETLLDTARLRHVRGNPNIGIAAALLDRAAVAGNSEANVLGAVVGFHDSIVTVGDEPATTEEPLY
ncbi:MAG TPA: DUF2125 domain-containing protein [Rhizomicrobium sp.]|nr:DUF2125 domain-containing protein [Rhizomicrobium sp.]